MEVANGNPRETIAADENRRRQLQWATERTCAADSFSRKFGGGATTRQFKDPARWFLSAIDRLEEGRLEEQTSGS